MSSDHRAEALRILEENPDPCEADIDLPPLVQALTYAVLYVGDQLASQRPEASPAAREVPRRPVQDRSST